jgi:hypothetical protein
MEVSKASERIIPSQSIQTNQRPPGSPIHIGCMIGSHATHFNSMGRGDRPRIDTKEVHEKESERAARRFSLSSFVFFIRVNSWAVPPG